MTTDSETLTNDPDDPDDRFGEAIAAFYEEVDAGSTPDWQAWLSRYPELAPRLADFFAAQQIFWDHAGPLADPPAAAIDILTEDERASFGDYVLHEVLGRGMSVVYRAWHRPVGTYVALKMIRAAQLYSPDELWRFHEDARCLAQLKHPNIVPILDRGENGGRQYFTMPLMEGGSLSQQVDVGPVASRRAAQWLLEVTRAIASAHKNKIVHRDLKPANVVLDAYGIAHVTDFGLAKRLSQDASVTATGTLMGTVAYMAPEGTYGTVNYASDIYGLGAILYALLTGKPPFKSNTIWDTVDHVRHQELVAPHLLNAKADRDLERLCLKCLQKNPERRYGNAAEVAEDLEAFLAGDPLPHNPRLSWISRFFRPAQFQLQFEPLRHFRRSIRMSAAIALVSHTAVFGFILTGYLTLAWLTLASLWTLIAVNVWVFLIRPARNAHPVEGYAVTAYVGYVLAYPFLFIPQIMGEIKDLLDVYPYLAVVTGFLVFIHGGLFWGRMYIFGLGYYVLAFVMWLSPEGWAPLEFGLCHCAFLILLSQHVYRLQHPKSETAQKVKP